MEPASRARMENPSLRLFADEEIQRHQHTLKTIAEFPKPGIWLKGNDDRAKVAVKDGELQRLHGFKWAKSATQAEDLKNIDKVTAQAFDYIFSATREDQLKMRLYKSSESPKSREGAGVKSTKEDLKGSEISHEHKQVIEEYEAHMREYASALAGFKNLVDVYTKRYEGKSNRQDELDQLQAHYDVFKSQFESVQADWKKRGDAEERETKLKYEVFHAIKGQHTEEEIQDPRKIKFKECPHSTSCRFQNPLPIS